MIRFDVIKPNVLDLDAMYKVLEEEMEKYGKFIRKDFEAVVKPWSDPKPTFTVETEMNPVFVEVRVVVGGPEKGVGKWIYVDRGTRPHTIRPKGGGVLVFPGAYSAGSAPGSKRTVKASSSGPNVYAREVHHPGTQARDFTGQIGRDHEKPMAAWMKAAMSKAARESGHGIK
jgi:hypothetical protein